VLGAWEARLEIHTGHRGHPACAFQVHPGGIDRIGFGARGAMHLIRLIFNMISPASLESGHIYPLSHEKSTIVMQKSTNPSPSLSERQKDVL